ncbi:flagellin [Paramagnetospirillum kuznetsovii]|uniref:Flagellin n=1 Tax=Paramagnetospirillum kuznetsovii TaxID=2053833 RepID=A0A364P1M1_9PROT|nr:flagellin [Paramagnetospirillum kuznetsovii]RAU23196.1 flagellin [Paramagnetospirillum kuznetsovii]
MADVTLSSAIRSNLLSLQATGSLVDRTNTRLSTGLKVSSAIDDAVSFFQNKSLKDRAGDMASRKDEIDQGISNLTTALGGVTAAEKLLTQMKGIVLSAKSASELDRQTLGTQLITLASQLNYLANDTSYQGLNLVNSTGSNIKVQFSEKTANVLQVDGADVRVSGGLVMTAFTMNASLIAGSLGISKISGVSMFAGFSSVSASVSVFDAYIAMFDSGVTSVRGTAKTLGSNVALLQTRADFTKEYINTMKIGGDKLVLADLNEEGANLVSLQTRQQLGIQALSFANRSEQGVLSLFR